VPKLSVTVRSGEIPMKKFRVYQYQEYIGIGQHWTEEKQLTLITGENSSVNMLWSQYTCN